MAAAVGDLDAEVPACPGWDVRQLLNHTGRVHRWATAVIRGRATAPVPFPGRPPVVDAQWFEEGVTELAAAIEGTGPEQAVWNFIPNAPGTVRSWLRRQAVETAVHRWDMEGAFGEGQPIEVELALAGTDEMLDVLLAGRQVDLGGSVHFHATDSPHGEWMVRIDETEGLVVGHGHDKGDVALRATASDLLLWLWGRSVPDDRLEVFGEATILDRWREGLHAL